MKPKLCNDCRHERDRICTAPQNTQADFVSGGTDYRVSCCWVHRNDELLSGWLMCRICRLCGREGRWWEPATVVIGGNDTTGGAI
jgi:hypothetical protein